MKRAACLLALAIISISATEAQPTDPGWYWTQDHPVTYEGYPYLPLNCMKAIAIPQEDVYPMHVIWEQTDQTAPDPFQIRYCKKTWEGWSPITQITHLPHAVDRDRFVTGYSIATSPNGQHAYVVYADTKYSAQYAGVVVIGLIRSNDGGATWQQGGYTINAGSTTWENRDYISPEEFTNISSPYYQRRYYAPCIAAANDGKVFVAWHRGLMGNEANRWLGFAYSSDYGSTWQVTDQIDDTYADNKFYPTIDTDPNGEYVHVAWQKLLGAQIVYKQLTYSTMIWSNLETLATFSLDPECYNRPSPPHVSCAKDGTNKVHIVWHDNSAHPSGTRSYDVHYRRSINNGDSWSENKILSGNENININSQYPVICAAPGNSDIVDLAYTENNTTVLNSDQAYWRRSTDGGASWDPITQLTTTGPNGRCFVATNRYGDAEFVFNRLWDGYTRGIYEKRYYIYPKPYQPFPSPQAKYCAEGDWIRQNGKTTGINGDKNLKATAVIDRNTIWSVGTKGALMKSSDGGFTWNNISVGGINQADYDFQDVCFVGSASGWIVGYKNNGTDKYGGILLRTTDGNTWYQDPLIKTYPFLSIKMASTSRGYIGCGEGYVLVYDGTSWTPTPKRPSSNSDSTAIWYHGLWINSDATQVIVSGDNSCLISKSMNGGNNWVILNDPASTTLFNQNYVFPLNTIIPNATKLSNNKLSASDAGNIDVALSGGKIAYISNGGAWNIVPPSATFPASQWYYDVTSAHKGVGSDGSANFGYRNLDMAGIALRDIAPFWDATTNSHWAVGDSGTVLRGCRPIGDLLAPDIAIIEALDQQYLGIFDVAWYDGSGINGKPVRFCAAPCVAGPWEQVGIDYTTDQIGGRHTEIQMKHDGNNFIRMEWPMGVDTVYTLMKQVEVTSYPSSNSNFLNWPHDLAVSPIAGSHGKHTRLTCTAVAEKWNYIYRKVVNSTDYELIDALPTDENTALVYDDYTVSPGKTYSYRVMYWDNFTGPRPTDTTETVPPITTADADYPPQVGQPSGYYDFVTKTLHITWPEVDPAAEPNLGGYWVCPTYLDAFKDDPPAEWTLSHTSPVERSYVDLDGTARGPRENGRICHQCHGSFWKYRPMELQREHKHEST